VKKKIFLIFIIFNFSVSIAVSQTIEMGKIRSLLNKDLEDTVKIKLYEYLAEYYSKENYDSAIRCIDKALLLNEKGNSPEIKARLFASKAKYCVETGFYEEALKLINEILPIYQSDKDLGKEAGTLVDKGMIYDYLGDYPAALQCYDSALTLANKVNDKKVIASALNRCGIIYEQMAQFHKAIGFYQRSLNISIEYNFENEIKNSYNYLGISYFYLGDYQHSLVFYQKYLEYSEKMNSQIDIAYAYGNIGMIYDVIKDYDKALLNYQKSLSIHKQINNKQGISNSLTSLGDFKFGNKKYDEALEYYFEVLKIAEELNDIRIKSYVYDNIGNVYHKQKKYDAAIEYYELSLALTDKIGDLGGKTWNNLYLGEVNFDKQEFSKAFRHFKTAYETALITCEKEVLKNSSKYLSDLYNRNGDYKNAYYYLGLYKTYSDSLVNADKIREITASDIKFQNEKEKQLEKLRQQQLELEYQKKLTKQRIFRNSLILGLVFVCILAILLYRNLKHKQKLNDIFKQQRIEILLKNEELMQMNHEINTTNDELSKRNNNITDSLRYAQKIQTALFPQQQLLKEYFSDGFVIHQPLEIVSGDFYWIKKISNKVVVAVADCTGHGVPGAFMSVMGIAYLNEISREKNMEKTGEMLDKLRLELKQSVEYSKYESDTRDGMDIALCSVNLDNLTAQFSGAINSLYIIRDKKLIVHKGDHQHIGLFDEEKKFNSIELKLQKGDNLYMFTDGYVDQFGGESGRKFLIKNFKNTLLDIAGMPMEEQKSILEKTLAGWQKGYQQVDDVLVLGIKI
jgi:serine phosphatase RsbU (regulator of sigma subunit)